MREYCTPIEGTSPAQCRCSFGTWHYSVLRVLPGGFQPSPASWHESKGASPSWFEVDLGAMARLRAACLRSNSSKPGFSFAGGSPMVQGAHNLALQSTTQPPKSTLPLSCSLAHGSHAQAAIASAWLST